MVGSEIEKLIKTVSKLPALGTRSARRIVLQLLKKKDTQMLELINALQGVYSNIKTCKICGNFDTNEICSICSNKYRKDNIICVVEDYKSVFMFEKSKFLCFSI